MLEQPDDDGPDWWPKFSFREGLIWLAQGFLLPLVITIATFALGFMATFVSSGFREFEESIKTGRELILLGLLFSGGAASLNLVIQSGFRWKTALRIFGLLLGIPAYWLWLVPIILK